MSGHSRNTWWMGWCSEAYEKLTYANGMHRYRTNGEGKRFGIQPTKCTAAGAFSMHLPNDTPCH